MHSVICAFLSFCSLALLHFSCCTPSVSPVPEMHTIYISLILLCVLNTKVKAVQTWVQSLGLLKQVPSLQAQDDKKQHIQGTATEPDLGRISQLVEELETLQRENAIIRDQLSKLPGTSEGQVKPSPMPALACEWKALYIRQSYMLWQVQRTPGQDTDNSLLRAMFGHHKDAMQRNTFRRCQSSYTVKLSTIVEGRICLKL